MKLLVLTQKIDVNDPVLGFFHRWVEEFAKHCVAITVICLQKGTYKFPANVKVLSLGKEQGVSRFDYVLRFYAYILRERKNYDTVFVHMNQEYVLLGGAFWRLWRKKIVMWRNHKKGSWKTRVAVALSHVVMCTSQESFTASFRKTKIMPVGIDIHMFKRDNSQKRGDRSILSLGRISAVKHVDMFVEALQMLDKKGVDFKASIYGDPTERDHSYFEHVKKISRDLEQKGKLSFSPSVPNFETLAIFNTHTFFVNMTESGSFDKTILEAMACEAVVLVSNASLAGALPKQLIFRYKDREDLAMKLQNALSLSDNERDQIGKASRRFVCEYHSLDKLTHEVMRSL